MTKVAIILDNPLRDFRACTLLAFQLALRGIQSHLVPMYDQDFFIQKIKPDYIVLNYVRITNAVKIKKYKAAGISIGVLDTEGGVFRSIENDYVGIIKKSDVWDQVDDFFVWGENQEKALVELCADHSPQVHLTGTPRYDSVKSPWVETLDKPLSQDGGYILFLTSFPVVNPNFTNQNQEAKIAKSVRSDSSTKEIDDAIAALKVAFESVKKLIRQVSSTFPNETIVVRPHPFENEKTYEQEFKDLKNVLVKKEGESIQWIRWSKLIIQLNSSTGIEAGFFGIHSILLGFLQDSSLIVPAVVKSSLVPQSKEEFFDMLDQIIRQDYSPSLQEKLEVIKENHQQITRDWYYKVDGKSAERIADVIQTRLADPTRNNRVQGLKKKQDIRIILRYYLKKAYHLMVNQKAWKKAQLKAISFEQVDRLITQLQSDGDHLHVEAQKHLFAPLKESKTIKIERQSTI